MRMKVVSTIVLLLIFAGISFILYFVAKSGFYFIEDTAIRITAMYVIPTVFFIGGTSFPLTIIWTKKEKTE